MNSNINIINKSRELFTEFKQLNDSLYKGNYQINNKLAGIYYLNFGNHITEEYFEEIQYKYLAEEFYNNENSVQWNIYLLFINSIITDELKSKILTNDKYARKLILKDLELLDYFELKKSNETSLPDIVCEWKNELSNVDLQEVYSDASYADAINNFLKNLTVKEARGGQTVNRNILTVDKISRIYLKDNYRDYPLQRSFEFGTVNLINGSNGTGKTSLLESIELILTGRSNRNKDKDEETGSISAILNENIKEDYTPADKGKYKARDLRWYSRNHPTKGNNCYQSFNQFNFFNTDAAYQFASSDHEDQINESLKQIVLGYEYSLLRDRISGFESRLRAELNGTDRKFKEQSEFIKKCELRIDELKSDKDFYELKKKIADNIKVLKYNNILFKDNFSISELYINEIKTELKFILNQNLILDFNSLNIRRDQISKQLDTVNYIKDEFNKRNSQRIGLQNECESLKNMLIKTKLLLQYYSIDDFSNIEHVEEQLQKSNFKLLRINKIKNEFPIIGIKHFLYQNISFDNIINLNKFDYQRIKDEITEIEKEIKIISDNFSKIEDLLNNIKLLGKDFLLHNQHIQHCPLCEQKITHSELVNKLNEDFKKSVDKSILELKYVKLSNLKIEEERLLSELQTLNSLKSIAQGEVLDYGKMTLNEISFYFNSILSEEAEVLEEKGRIDWTLSTIKSFGGSISELISLKSEVGTFMHQDTKFKKSDLDRFHLYLEEKISRTNDAIGKLNQENDLLIAELKKSLHLKEETNDISYIQNKIEYQIENIKSLENSFLKIRNHIAFTDDKSIIELSKDLHILEENIKSLKDSENRQQELQRLLIELENAKKFITANTEKYSRLNRAVEVLQKLKLNDSDSVLDEYFNNNLNEIKDIFRTIHAPQEFTDLRFENRSLVLYKNEIKHFISQISTGQRTALVISIFISLNRKLKNGPNILIFDDPVTFIDDFNALSFLDFLRYFIVKEKKQIFFATANKKFSTLFKKKFEFLGDEYKEFNLER